MCANVCVLVCVVCVRVCEWLSPFDRFCGGEGLTVPGGTLMSHGNSDVMEAQPQLDLSVCECVCVCVGQNKKASAGTRLRECVSPKSEYQVTGDW